MEVILKCKIPKKQRRRESSSTLQHPKQAILRKRFTTLSLRKSSNNFKRSFKPEKPPRRDIGVQPKEVARKVDDRIESLSPTLLLSGSTSYERGWKRQPIADLKALSQDTGPEAVTPILSTRILVACKLLRQKWFQWWELGLWINAWQLVQLEWVLTRHLPQRELVGMM